ncbi:histidine phosphatase family protein [Actinoplanes sp. NPDC026619]|uniref:histidine phosphatase family protein n=1 Tax=Actinoplanes sp. NPDC026619 TaxID=3155798 RepID=UPI003407E865
MARTQLYLVRHAEAEPHDGDLSAHGREQAERLGRRLRPVPFAAIHHSPLPRAAQTADLVGGHLPQVPRHACARRSTTSASSATTIGRNC